jgi:hypothetical protein
MTILKPQLKPTRRFCISRLIALYSGQGCYAYTYESGNGTYSVRIKNLSTGKVTRHTLDSREAALSLAQDKTLD